MIFLCLILVIISAGCVSAADDANQTEITGSGDFTGNFGELQNLIYDADEGSTLTLEKDYKGSGMISIKKPLAINGSGHSIDAESQSGIFYIESDVDLYDIGFYNAYDEYVGGAIYAQDCTLYIEGCYFENNAAGFGGAIFTHNVDLGIAECIFAENYAFDTGGAIYADGSDLTLIDSCYFEENAASEEYGNSIFAESNLLVSNCVFKSSQYAGDFLNFYDEDGRYSLYLEGNEMNGVGDYEILYEGTRPIISNTNLVFENKTANREDSVEIAEFTDDNGNTIKIDEITVKFTNTETSQAKEELITYDDKEGGFYYICDLDDGVYALTGSVSENVASSVTVTKGTLTVGDKKNVKITAPNLNKYFGGSEEFKATVTNNAKPVAGEYVYVTIDGQRLSKTTDAQGTVSVSTANLNVGSHDVITEYGDKNATSTITVKSTISAKDTTGSYQDTQFSATLLDTKGNPLASKEVKFTVESSIFSATTNSNGVATASITLKPGTYTITTTNPNSNEQVSNRLVIEKTKTNVVLSQENTLEGVVITAAVTPNDASGNVNFDVNGKKYTQTVKKGNATLTLSNLDYGKYTVNAQYSGDSKYNLSSAKPITFTIDESSVIISAPDLEKYFKGPERFVVSLADAKGKPLAGEKVKVTINGETYDRVTSSEGKTTFAIGLNSGVYDAVTEYKGEVVKSKITVKSTVTGSDVTKVFRNATNYVASFVDAKGNKLTPSAPKVEININGVKYYRSIKDDGSISFTLNLEQGTYILTTNNPVTGENVANKVTILPRITNNHDLTKYYRNDSQYTFTLIGDNGKPIAGAKATININGVFYSRTTKDNGSAVFQINLEPGTYILTVEYKECRVSNTVKVLNVILGDDLTLDYKDGSKYVVKILDGQGKPLEGAKIKLNINGVIYNRTTQKDGSASLAINLNGGTYIITVSYNGLNHANKITVRVPTTKYDCGNGHSINIPVTASVKKEVEDSDYYYYDITYDNGEYGQFCIERADGSVNDYISFWCDEWGAKHIGSYKQWAILDFSPLINQGADGLRYCIVMKSGYFYSGESDNLDTAKKIVDSFV